MVSPDKCIAGRSAADWIAAYPVVSDLCALKETAWVNPDKLPFAQAAAACPLTLADIEDAAARLELPVVKSQCPADGCTSRKETELLVAELEKQFPDLRKKVMGAMQRAGLDHWG